jgi:hypothetical protein
MVSPVSFWQAAKAPKLYITAAFKTKATHAHIMWRTGGPNGKGFASNAIAFEIIGNGKYRTYVINMSDSPKYKGVITQLRFDPVPNGAKGDFVKVRSIAFTRADKQ